MMHENLTNYYSSNYVLHANHNFLLSEIDNMIPFEKKLYIKMVINTIQELSQK